MKVVGAARSVGSRLWSSHRAEQKAPLFAGRLAVVSGNTGAGYRFGPSRHPIDG